MTEVKVTVDESELASLFEERKRMSEGEQIQQEAEVETAEVEEAEVETREVEQAEVDEAEIETVEFQGAKFEEEIPNTPNADRSMLKLNGADNNQETESELNGKYFHRIEWYGFVCKILIIHVSFGR